MKFLYIYQILQVHLNLKVVQQVQEMVEISDKVPAAPALLEERNPHSEIEPSKSARDNEEGN